MTNRKAHANGSLIKTLRVAKKWTQEELVAQADKLLGNVSERTLVTAEGGGVVKLDTLASIAMVLGVPVIDLVDLDKHTAANATDTEVLVDRKSVYQKAIDLIANSHERVLDTTWGLDIEGESDPELPTIDEYHATKDHAFKGRKISYHEVIAPNGSEKRAKRIAKAVKDSAEYPNYKVRILPTFLEEIPLIDFLVVDGNQVLLSLVHTDDYTRGHKYLAVNSAPIALFFSEYFEKCWLVKEVK